MIEFSEAQLLSWLGQFLWPFFRIGGMLMVAPLFASSFIPVPIRLLLALSLSAAIVPMLPPPPVDVIPFSGIGLFIGVQQLIIGMAAGFVLQLVFDAIVVGFQTVAMSMGLGFAVMVDSQRGQQVPMLSQFHFIIAILLFLAMDGHLMMIGLMIDSFEQLPVGVGGLDAEAFRQIAAWGTHMFAGALRVALPAATAILLVNLSIGVISRAAPTLNLFAVGFPITMLTGYLVMMVSLPMLDFSLRILLEKAWSSIFALWGG
ncbi:MAG: flagellar biosynthetic protein FliR [Wenzhouxiangella sp.]